MGRGEVDSPVEVVYSDSTFIDSFGRLRVSNPVGLFENKNIHDRSKNQWEEPIEGAIITYENLVGGPFQVAESITGATSGTIGTVTAVDGGSVTITYVVNHDDFEVAEEIEGDTSGATADTLTVGTGSTITFVRNKAAVTLQVGASSGDSAVRTSHRYFSYIPGKAQLITQTFLFGTAIANVRRRVGYFDPENGIYLEQTNDGLRIVRRTKTSGSAVNNEVEQGAWSIDKMDGTGVSGVNLDFSKIQFLFIDFQWQGTGRVRVGFSINGQYYTAHEFNTSNSLTTVYMSTPSLPVRYEISNTAVTAGTNTMAEFCTAVVSEGGEKLTGVGFTISRGIVARSVTTEVPVLAIRLKSNYNGDNRKTIQFSNASIFVETNNAHFEIKHLHGPTGITATWTDVGGGSSVEYSTDITAITGNPAHAIEEGYAPAGGAPGKGGNENVVSGDKLDQHRFLTQNIDSTNSEVFAIFAISLTGASDIYAHISWVEFE